MSASQPSAASSSKPAASGVCAIVVLFHPDADFGQRLCAIQAQFSLVVLVDNTPGDSAFPALPKSVFWLRNGRNLGIAKALNQGIQLAIGMGCEWCATFDQDSELLPGYLSCVMAIATRHAPMPALIGCNYLSTHLAKVAHAVPPEATAARQRQTIITSGTFMSTHFAKKIGGFREDYFIDSVDHEFCLRARRHGAKVLMTAEPFMRHRMGNAGAELFGIVLSLQHPAARRYYMARNTLLTLWAHGVRYPSWALRNIGRLLGEGFAMTFLESDRGPKLRAFARGLWHGLIGRSGPVEKT